jgi:hypothetical protein
MKTLRFEAQLIDFIPSEVKRGCVPGLAAPKIQKKAEIFLFGDTL